MRACKRRWTDVISVGSSRRRDATVHDAVDWNKYGNGFVAASTAKTIEEECCCKSASRIEEKRKSVVQSVLIV